jgi:integrase
LKRNLTAVALAALKPTEKPYYIADARAPGLRVRVAPTGAKSWNMVWRVQGDGTRSASLGPADPEGRVGFDIAAARDRAAAILKAGRQGRDLLAEEREQRQAARDAMTVGDLIDHYGTQIASPNRRGGPLRTAREIESRLQRALATKLDRPAGSLHRGDVSRLLDKVALEHPREAEKRRQQIGALYSWAIAKGFAETNPASGLPSYGLGETRDRVLSPEEIRLVWRWLDTGADAMPPDCIVVLRLQLLTGARVSEVGGMEASEVRIDGDGMTWTLPADRSKNKKERVTPIVGRARAIVEAALKARPSGPLFLTANSGRPLRATDLGQALLHRELPVPHFSTHDLRRTVVSLMDGELGLPLDTIAATIGHRRGSADTRTLVRHYSRPKLDDRIKTALTTWGDYLDRILVGADQPGGNVIPLRKSDAS